MTTSSFPASRQSVEPSHGDLDIGRSLTDGWQGGPCHHRSSSDSSSSSSSTVSSLSVGARPTAKSAVPGSRVSPWLHTASTYSHLFNDVTQDVYVEEVRPSIAQTPRAVAAAKSKVVAGASQSGGC